MTTMDKKQIYDDAECFALIEALCLNVYYSDYHGGPTWSVVGGINKGYREAKAATLNRAVRECAAKLRASRKGVKP